MLLAAALREASPDLEFTNLGRRGAVATTVRRDQLGAALARRPDLATVVVGVNDVLTPGAWVPGRFATELDRVVGALRRTGARVVTARLHDPAARLPLPARLARGVAERVAALDQAVDTVSARHGALVVDLADRPELADRTVWSLDRLHPTETGHRLLAAEVADLLRADGLAVGPVPRVPGPGDRGTGHAGHLLWLLRDGGPWFAGQQVRAVRALAAARRLQAGRERAGGAGGR